MKTAKEILMAKATESNDGFLSGQVKWIVEAMEEYASLKSNPKIIIKVQGGQVEETISTSKDVVINIADYDGIRTSEKDDLFTHWNCEADRIVSEEEFKKLADDMDHNFKVSFK